MKRCQPIMPGSHRGLERGIGLKLLGGGEFLSLEQPERIFGGEQVLLFGGSGIAHDCRHSRSRSSPRRIQLFMVPSGTAARAASWG